MKDEGGRNWVSSNLKYDSGSVLSVLPEMCSQGRHQRLSDFDDHLNDISRCVPSLCAVSVIPILHRHILANGCWVYAMRA